MVNIPEFFVSHRLPIAVAAQAAGYEVHIASASGDGIEQFTAMGFTHHIVPFARSGQNPWQELKTLYSLVSLFNTLKPTLVHLITIKPVLYGGLAARWAGISAVVSAVSGLGTVFLANSWLARLRRGMVASLYRAAFKQKRLAVIFQNPDDRDMLLGLKALTLKQVQMIRGSGVALANYPVLPEPDGPVVVVMAARLLRDKGVFEFVEAARLLKQRKVNVVMKLVGDLDPQNPTSVTSTQLEQWRREGCVDILGYRKDIAQVYSAANIVCLPSYREGLPKSLIEAAACGRAVVTTDVPGCRDAITPDTTGLLVPVMNASLLADAVERLATDPELRAKFGVAGRHLAEEAFAIEKIVDQHLAIYRQVLEQ